MFRSIVWRGILALVLLVVLVAGVAAVGVVTYNAGMARGLADSGKVVAQPPASVMPYPYWGFFGPGFGLFNCLLLFFGFALIFLVVRGLLWGGLFGMWRRPWHHGWGGPDAPHGWRRTWEKGYPPFFDDWHRRAHGQGEPTPPPSDPNQV